MLEQQAYLYSQLEKHKEAIDNIDKLLSLSPNNKIALLCRARFYLSQQKIREALNDLNTILSIKLQEEQFDLTSIQNKSFTDAEAFALRSDIYYSEKKQHLALSDIDQAIDIIRIILYKTEDEDRALSFSMDNNKEEPYLSTRHCLNNLALISQAIAYRDYKQNNKLPSLVNLIYFSLIDNTVEVEIDVDSNEDLLLKKKLIGIVNEKNIKTLRKLNNLPGKYPFFKWTTTLDAKTLSNSSKEEMNIKIN